MKTTLVLGGPGCGKTTRCLKIMEDALARGVHPSQVAFVSFTNAAADEARERAMKRFSLTEDDLPYFRTLHSLAFREMGVNRNDVVGSAHLAELAELTGELTDGEADATVPQSGASAHPLITVDGIARMTRRTLRDAWETNQIVGGELDWYRLKRFSDAYRHFREDRGLLDFTDMLERYVTEAWGPSPVRVAIVDEAQDLTLLQWKVVERAFARADELWVAGDDDQGVHEWAGAARGYLMGLPYGREVLPLSHRLPSKIFELSQEIVGRIDSRFRKDISSARPGGLVEWVSRVEECDLSAGTWLLLARTKHQLTELAEEARRQGVVYTMKGAPSVSPRHVEAIKAYEALRRGDRVDGSQAAAALRALGRKADKIREEKTYSASELEGSFAEIWHDALVKIPLDDREYYLACRRRGERLDGQPRVRVETVHGAKGAEAENVFLGTDMTYRVKRGYEADPDAEHRVWYVGATRAQERLYLGASRTVYGYPM